MVRLTLMLLVSVVAASADSWYPPNAYSVQSSSKALRFTVHPPELTNVIALSYLSREDYLLVARIEGDAARKRLHCEGVLERVSPDGKTEFLWRRPLVNPVAPAQAMISDTTNGVFIVTIDDWGALGTSSNTVVIYNLNGQRICSKTLDDLIGKEKDELKRTASSIPWAGKQRFDESGKHLILQVDLPGRSKEVKVELSSCNVINKP